VRYLRVRNWEEFQHYKDRDPPWIKIHNRLLDDFEFCILPDATKAHLLCIWMLASRTDNKIPDDAVWLAAKIGATEPVDLELLKARSWLVEHPASDTLAPDASKVLAPDASKVLAPDASKVLAPDASNMLALAHADTRSRYKASYKTTYKTTDLKPMSGSLSANADPIAPNSQNSLDSLSVIEQAKVTYGLDWRKPHRFLKARIRDGATVEDCMVVIADRVKYWSNDEKMRQYLRQETLFREGKFEGYLQAAKFERKPIEDEFSHYDEIARDLAQQTRDEYAARRNERTNNTEA
jgi:uncharacterized phage protein (TIGR02220 family)